MNTIIFEGSLREKIIKISLGKDVNEDGDIIDKNTGQEVLNPEGTVVNIDNFGGFENGSEIFIKNDMVSLMDYSNK